MSTLNINIPIRNIDAEDVKQAFAFSYGYTEQIQVGGVLINNPITKEEFVKQKCVNFILDVLASQLVKNEEQTAKEIVQNLVAERSADVTQWFDNRRLEAIGGIGIYQQFPNFDPIEISTFIGQSVDFTLSGTDPNNLSLTFFVTENAKNGILNGDSPNFTYVPNSTFFGFDEIKFKCTNGTLNSLEKSVIIEVKKKITIQNKFYTVRKNNNFEFTLDTNHNNGEVNYIFLDNPVNGTLTGDNPYIYQPNLDFVGEDIINYKAQDNSHESDISIIHFEIVNFLVESNDFNIQKNESISVYLVALNSVGNVNYEIISQPTNGSLVVENSGESVIYTPNLDYVGDDFFTYQATDDLGTSEIGTVSITISS